MVKKLGVSIIRLLTTREVGNPIENVFLLHEMSKANFFDRQVSIYCCFSCVALM